MKRNTQTTLGQLREGDRFYFMSDTDTPLVRFVIRLNPHTVTYNKINHRTGKNGWFFNRSKPNEKPVMFIRHINLLPGDQCFMQELTDGDVFYRPIDKTKREMRRGKEMHNGQIMVRYVGSAAWLHTSPLTTGIFVRRASLKTNTDVQQKTTD